MIFIKLAEMAAFQLNELSSDAPFKGKETHTLPVFILKHKSLLNMTDIQQSANVLGAYGRLTVKWAAAHAENMQQQQSSSSCLKTAVRLR